MHFKEQVSIHFREVCYQFVLGGTITLLITFIVVICLLVPLLLEIAVLTWIERRFMANIQRRIGPNVVGAEGLLQAIADGLKLVVKEQLIPRNANKLLFLLAPVLVLVFAIYVWFFLPLNKYPAFDYNLTLLYVVVISVLEIYGILFAGWSSNSKYALLGGLRSSAQMISYEITLSFIFLSVILWAGSFNFNDLYIASVLYPFWFCLPLLPFSIIYLISMLAESNRAPFDLPEAEAELVAGYNVEYSGFLFALFFLGEYAKMLFLSGLYVLLFLGGGVVPQLLRDHPTLATLDPTIIFSIKSLTIFCCFIWVRASLPRYRYDQLMILGWKIFLPITFSCLIVLIYWLLQQHSFPSIMVM